MPLPLAAIGLGVSALGGISKMIGGGRRKRQQTRELEQLVKSRQEITNINEGRRISMRGAEMAREEIARGTATSLDALRSGGIRGAVGGVQSVQESNNRAALQQGAMVDQAQMALESEFAQDEARMRAMEEQRQFSDEGRAQAGINAAQQDQYSGLGDIASSAFGAAALGLGSGTGGQTGGGQGAGGMGVGLNMSQPQINNAFGGLANAFNPMQKTQYDFNKYRLGEG